MTLVFGCLWSVCLFVLVYHYILGKACHAVSNIVTGCFADAVLPQPVPMTFCAGPC